MFLAQNLKYLRSKAGEKQRDIAELLHVSEMTVSRYESGENEPELGKVLLISKHYDVTVDELLTINLVDTIPLYIKNVKFLRKKHEMTQSDMAELLGFRGKSSLCAVETGKVGMSIDNFVKLADYFGVTLDQMVKQDLSKECDSHEK